MIAQPATGAMGYTRVSRPASTAAGTPTALPIPGWSLSPVEAFLAGRSPRTVAAYRADLEDFRAFLGAPTIDAAAVALLASQGTGNGIALAYRAHLLERELAPATVNRRLAALRSLVKVGRLLGRVSWLLEVESVKGGKYRDTRGPGTDGVRRILAALAERGGAKGIRDAAIVRLLHSPALRRGELVALDLTDLNLETGALRVIGKGRREPETLTLPTPTLEALRAWVAVRGTEPGPLFANLDRAKKGQRLTGTSVHRIVRLLGQAVGLPTRPHGLRHAGITEALERTGGNLRAAARFSRHRDWRTLAIYDDNREDVAGQVAQVVAESV